jgi:hypothetical protein
MVAAFVRTIFAQPDTDAAYRQLREVATRLERSLPKAAAALADAEDDVTTYAAFPRHHWRKIWSTNPLERVNKAIKRRTNIVGVFPNHDAVLRLVGAILAEQHDEWQTSDRRYLTMNRTTVLGLEQHITLELEAAKHETRHRGPHRNTPLDRTLPIVTSGESMFPNSLLMNSPKVPHRQFWSCDNGSVANSTVRSGDGSVGHLPPRDVGASPSLLRVNSL